MFDKAALGGATLCFGGPHGIIFHSSCATPKGMKGLGVKHLSIASESNASPQTLALSNIHPRLMLESCDSAFAPAASSRAMGSCLARGCRRSAPAFPRRAAATGNGDRRDNRAG